MDDVVSFSIQQKMKPVVTLPTEEEMKYWDDHYREIPKEIRNRNMASAENDLSALKLNTGFMNIFSNLPIDLQSCVPIMMAAKKDLDVIDAMNDAVMIA